MEIKERCRRGAFLAVWAAALVFWLLLSGLGLQPALGAGKAQEPERVFDYAGIFAEGEKDLLEETITQLREEMKAEVVVLTVKEAGGLPRRLQTGFILIRASGRLTTRMGS